MAEAVAGRALVGLSAWECEAAQSRQARPAEAQELSWGTAKGGDLANHAVLPSSSHSLKSFCSTSIFFCRIFLRSASICS